jgi:hypothetical protein
MSYKTLVKHIKKENKVFQKENKVKSNVQKLTFHTFEVLNAQITKKIFINKFN